MNVTTNQINNLPPEQQAIREKYYHPLGTFVEFPIEDVESSIPAPSLTKDYLLLLTNPPQAGWL